MAEHDQTGPEPEVHSYIPPGAQMRECTPRAIILGAILGAIFGMSSLYLVLKVGITVSASIPVAVISLTLFRVASKVFGIKDATILENNIVQTAGSAGESIAFGLGVTMPAILILGFDLEYTRVILVAVLGGLLGILMMIPLRRALIVQQHKELKYPEGTACAEVLKAGANEESRAMASAAAQNEAKTMSQARGESQPNAVAIFSGFGIGLLYKTAMSALRLWKDTPEKIFGAPFNAGSVSMEISPELLGVGYIIGPKISCIMAAGGVLSYLVLIPLIKFFGDGMAMPVAPATKLIKDMGPDAIRNEYILYIGAGAVAMGGIVSLLRSGPTILRGIKSGLADFTAGASAARASAVRTDRDLSMKFVLFGSLALIVAILLSPSLKMNLVGALLIVVCGFLFVTVSSRLTGEIGSSSNPISGMTIATLLLTCLIFVLIGWVGREYYVTALSVGGIVCIAASNGGSTSQDLKTGYLLGSTPKYQQIAILVGAAVSALALGPVLLQLNKAGTVYVPAAQASPGIVVPANAEIGAPVSLFGPQRASDTNLYRVWEKLDDIDGKQGRYLVDQSGTPVWFVSPGMNPSFTERPDGTHAVTFSPPKAVLISYIIKGILSSKLPWALVLFGVMTSVVLELCGISSLAFAVGVYLPLSSSTPLMVGGLIRWLVDLGLRRKLHEHKLTEEQIAAESDKSPGVLLASGYIAGGAIAGIIIAFLAGALPSVDKQITDWAEAKNPFYRDATPDLAGHSDLLALIPFVVMVAFLYFVGREKLLANRRPPDRTG